MGYMHITNLYRPEAQDILLFKRVFVLEKVHGTSAHIKYNDGVLTFFSGSEKHDSFMRLFNVESLKAAFDSLGRKRVVIYGEAYGGKQQHMSETYGKSLRFIAFDVMIDDAWCSVPKAHDIVTNHFGLEFVPWQEIDCEMSIIDAHRDAPSEVANRCGCGSDKEREGIVIRPPFEVTRNDGSRVIAKHKGKKFAERLNVPNVSQEKLVVMTAANAIADEWVTDMRMTHVLDKLHGANDISATPTVISAMIEDVMREADGEIVDTKEVRSAISKKAATLFKSRLRTLKSKLDD